MRRIGEEYVSLEVPVRHLVRARGRVRGRVRVRVRVRGRGRGRGRGRVRVRVRVSPCAPPRARACAREPPPAAR